MISDRKRFLWSRTAAAILLMALLVAACGREEEAAAPERPNIVYILADDAGYADVGAYGQERFATPNIDRMADEGIRFTQHYAGATVCAPSRSALMTGLHTGHTFVRGNERVDPEGRPGGQVPLPDSIYTLAEMLQDAGYATGAFGKWGLGYPGSEGDPTNQGFDRFFGYIDQTLAHNYYPRYLWDDTTQVDLPGNADDGTGTYAPDLIHERALQFIDEHQNEPFFLFIPTPIPHAELLVPEDSTFQRFRERFDEPEPYEGVDYGESRYRQGPYASQDHPRAAFAAMMTRLDRQVGDVLRAIDSLGLGENTIVMFTSDNGPHVEGGADPDFFDSNGPLRGYKRDLYEGGIRVPFIVRWPAGVEAGAESDHVSAFWDVVPTLADVTGARYPGATDGLSFLPTLQGQPEEQAAHDHLYWEFHEGAGSQAVRRGDWKAVRNGVGADPDAPIELYDLAADVGETHDVAAEHPDVVREMARLMESSRTPSALFNFGRDQ